MRVAFAAVLVASSALAQTTTSAITASAPFDARYSVPVAGSWSYAATAATSDATFADSAGRPLLVIHCARATRRVNISRVTAAASSSLSMWTSSASRSVSARFDPLTLRVTAEFVGNDALLDAIAFSRGRFSVSSAGTLPLVVPAWPEPARAVEDCRN